MQTKTKYEEIAFKELRAILQAIKILRTLREGIFAAKIRCGDNKKTGN